MSHCKKIYSLIKSDYCCKFIQIRKQLRPFPVGKMVVIQEKKNYFFSSSFNGCSNNLSSRAVSSKVFSALVSLTSVFGMRTGGTSPLTSPQWYISDFSVYIVFLVYIKYTLFLTFRQFIYTADSQLHRFFSVPFSPWLIVKSGVL